MLPAAQYVFPPAAVQPHPVLNQAHVQVSPHMIVDDGNSSIANILCFGAFANTHTGIVYSNLTGNFPFMSFNGSVCFLVMYHYESNVTLAMPISSLDDLSIYNAYKKGFNKLASRGSNPS
jgi:hypothetical protein